jgi:hypothetical protein
MPVRARRIRSRERTLSKRIAVRLDRGRWRHKQGAPRIFDLDKKGRPLDDRRRLRSRLHPCGPTADLWCDNRAVRGGHQDVESVVIPEHPALDLPADSDTAKDAEAVFRPSHRSFHSSPLHVQLIPRTFAPAPDSDGEDFARRALPAVNSGRGEAHRLHMERRTVCIR